MNLKKKVFSSPSLGKIELSYTDVNFYKKKKENKNKSYTLSDYKELFKNYYKNKSIEINKDSHHEINNYYLKCQRNLKNYFMNDKNKFGLKFEGNKTLEKCPINKFNNIFNEACSAREQILKNQILNYYYPNDNNDKLMGNKMKLTPIPSRKYKFMKNQNEKNEFLKARRSAVCMRRLEYTHGLKKNNSQEYYTTINNDKNNFLPILKGAILIIEDWWIKILRKRYEITSINNNDINNNSFELSEKDLTNSIEQNILENLNYNNENKTIKNEFIDNWLTRQAKRLIEKNENINGNYNFHFSNDKNLNTYKNNIKKNRSKNNIIVFNNKNNSDILFKSNKRYNNNESKIANRKKNNPNPIKIIQNSNVPVNLQNNNAQSIITPSNYLQNYFRDYCLNNKQLYNTCSHKSLKSFEFIQKKYKTINNNQKQKYINFTSSLNNENFIMDTIEIIDNENLNEDKNKSSSILRGKKQNKIFQNIEESKNNGNKDISSEIEPIKQDDMINIINQDTNYFNNKLIKNNPYQIRYNIIKNKNQNFNNINSDKSSLDGSVDEIITKKLKEIHENNQKYFQRILKAYNQVKFFKTQSLEKNKFSNPGEINNYHSADFIKKK